MGHSEGDGGHVRMVKPPMGAHVWTSRFNRCFGDGISLDPGSWGTLSMRKSTSRRAGLSFRELGVLNSTEPRLRMRVSVSVIQKQGTFPAIQLGNTPMQVIESTHYSVLAQSQWGLQADVGVSSSGPLTPFSVTGPVW